MLGQLVLPSPYVTAFVFIVWTMMLRPKCRLCIEMVKKYVELMGEFTKISCRQSWGEPGLCGFFHGNCWLMIFVSRKYEHIGSFDQLPRPKSGSENFV